MNNDFSTLVIYPDHDSRRILPLQGAINFRDLGGYHTVDGRQVRWGRVYRAASLSRLTDSDLKYLETIGVRTICDLRNDNEVANEPDRVPASAAYRRMPLVQTENYSDGLDAFLSDLAHVEEMLTWVDANAPTDFSKGDGPGD